MIPTLTRDALAARREAALAQPAVPPSGPARHLPFRTQLRSKLVDVGDKQFYRLEGHASTTEQPYEMWDFWGPYTEVVSRGAFARTLGSNPDVAFLVNHSGLTMARTTAGTLELSEDEIGLLAGALLNPQRADVQDLVHAVDDGAIDQMSFAFSIVRGAWSPDYMEYRIDEVDIDRGDVSAVNFGANPYTDIAARARRAFEAIDALEGAALVAAQRRLAARLAASEQSPAGATLGTLRALVELDRA